MTDHQGRTAKLNKMGQSSIMKQDLLTVLLLVYNHKDFIEKALDSILAQKTDFPFTIYVAEDCSTDGTQGILLRYKEKYPEKIELQLNDVNLGAEKNMRNALLGIKTKYFAFLEGDDRWCDENKLQMQVNAMEKNPGCTMCGHNTLTHDVETGEDSLFIDAAKERASKQIYSVNDPFRVHPSSRVYRNILDFSGIPETMIYDTAMYLLYISKGDLYYINRVMSVYNITGQGMMSGKKRISRTILSLTVAYNKNLYFGFKYDKQLSPPSKVLKFLKMLFGKRLGWFIFFHWSISMLKLKRSLMSRIGGG
jgi:glycosyltransferase involved in cell wall biosynthesis